MGAGTGASGPGLAIGEDRSNSWLETPSGRAPRAASCRRSSSRASHATARMRGGSLSPSSVWSCARSTRAAATASPRPTALATHTGAPSSGVPRPKSARLLGTPATSRGSRGTSTRPASATLVSSAGSSSLVVSSAGLRRRRPNPRLIGGAPSSRGCGGVAWRFAYDTP